MLTISRGVPRAFRARISHPFPPFRGLASDAPVTLEPPEDIPTGSKLKNITLPSRRIVQQSHALLHIRRVKSLYHYRRMELRIE